MKGRKPIPSRIKALRGNVGKREIKPEVQISGPIGACPPHLSAQARKEWKRIVPVLEAVGLATAADRAALAAYCQAYGRWVGAEAALKGQALVFENDKGQTRQNPLIGIANKALDQMRAFLVEFGMTPSSRTRIAPAAKPPKDKFEEWLSDSA